MIASNSNKTETHVAQRRIQNPVKNLRESTSKGKN